MNKNNPKVDLPDKFEDAIQLSEVKKQDILKAYAEKNRTIVELDTERIQAEFQANVTIVSFWDFFLKIRIWLKERLMP